MNQEKVEAKPGTIETHDLYFAAFLAAKDCRLADTRKEGRKVTFIFESEQSKELLAGYFNSDESDFGMVSAMKYADKIRALKSRCFINGG